MLFLYRPLVHLARLREGEFVSAAIDEIVALGFPRRASILLTFEDRSRSASLSRPF